jgi:CheY-like chemotaxis protein
MILIAEDNTVVASYLKAHLKIKGYEVIVAEDGFRAWTMMQKQMGVIQLVISDVSMPVMSGINLVERMRAVPEMKDIPVIFASGVASPQIVAQAANFGKVHFLVKPLTMDVLLPKLRELIPFSIPVLRDKEQIKREFNLDETQYRKVAAQFLTEVEAAIDNLNSGLRNYTIFTAIQSLKFLEEGADLLGAVKFKTVLDGLKKGEDIEVDTMLLELRALAQALKPKN